MQFSLLGEIMAAIASQTINDGTHPTPVGRVFSEKGSSGGVATWMYQKTASMVGWVKIVLTRKKMSAKSSVRSFVQYVYLPVLATVNSVDVLVRYHDSTVTLNVHKDGLNQEIRDLLAFTANPLAKAETISGMMGDAAQNDNFPS